LLLEGLTRWDAQICWRCRASGTSGMRCACEVGAPESRRSPG
jgi:hypothetical protein